MREQEYRAAQRSEERQHELTMTPMLLPATQNTAANTIPTAFQCSNYPIVPGPNFENMHYSGPVPALIDVMKMTTLNCEFIKTTVKNKTFGR